MLFSVNHCPVIFVCDALAHWGLLYRLLSECKDDSIKAYFARQFPAVPKATIAALQRRIQALFASSSVRLALAGNTAPNFRRFMDEGKIVLVNCFSQSISRDVRRVLQG